MAYAVREKIGLDLSPTVVVGSRLEEAVKGWGELEELCRVCEGFPFLLSVRVRGTLFLSRCWGHHHLARREKKYDDLFWRGGVMDRLVWAGVRGNGGVVFAFVYNLDQYVKAENENRQK